jgi:3-deoxy-D-manno-octulosonic-acid transferase
MRALTDAAYLIAALLASPVWLWWLLRTQRHRTDWRARFGEGAALPGPGPRGRVLVHAVSMGEVNAARLLVERLAARHEVVLSATTDTGFARAQSVAPAGVTVVRYPLDLSGAVEKFLDRVQPDLVVLVELEAWPNFIRGCGRRGVPIVVVNGRISDRGFRRYRLARPFLKPLFRSFRFVSAQTDLYAERFMAMGVPADRVHTGGTMKWDAAQTISADGVRSDGAPAGASAFDHAAAQLALELGIDRSRPLVVAGSTAEGEERLLHESVPVGVQLLCAPRRPDRFDAAAAELPGCVRRSARPVGAALGAVGSDRFLLDTMGELRKAYALATVVVVGRSFGDGHGSDMMEPAALGKPALIGPRYGDFADTAGKLIEAGALVSVDREALPRTLQELLVDASRRQDMGEAALAVIRREQGATERNERLIDELLRESLLARGRGQPAAPAPKPVQVGHGR